MATLLSGRLVTDGSGRLFIQPTDNTDVTPTIHTVDKKGIVTEQLIDTIVEVTWSEADGGYIEVLPGEDSHNVRHEQNVLDISGTTGPLFDAAGNLVVPGDPHHDGPVPNDAHFDPDAPGLTKADTIPDEISSTATGHTEAYTA